MSAPPTVSPRYTLIAPIGSGSMGSVFRARDRLSGHDVALKRVQIGAAHSPDRARDDLLSLTHEFRTLAGLRHPHIISVLDYGLDSERKPFFTMDLVEQPLTILEAGRPLAPRAKIDLLIQGLEALAYLHRRGVLHHDLKPANILIRNGHARVLDFGLAVLAHQHRESDAFGTLLYLAPEVIDGRPYSERSDIYSMGVIAYELLLGRHPFDAGSVRTFLRQVRSAAPDISGLADQPQLAAVVAQMLAKQTSERPTAHQAIDALRSAIGLPEPDSASEIRESYLQAASFIGREAELAQLGEAIAAAQSGRGSMWLIGGESGVGKSRLLDELRTQALVAGLSVLRGQAIAGGGLPYQLWRAPLRHMILDGEIGDLEAGTLRELVPDIGDLLGRALPEAPPLSSQEHQLRLRVTISDLVRRRRQPALLLLEDLQWSDESIEPLRLLAGDIGGLPICIIGSYRSDERPTLPGELPDMRRLHLERLTADRIAELASSMLGPGGATPQLVGLLQRETEGNALFLVEVVRELARSAGDLARVQRMPLPQTVMAGGMQQVLRNRLTQMPAWGRALLQSAAVLGRQIDPQLLLQVDPAIDLQRWLRAGADAAILEVSDQQWRFSHDKLREALLSSIGDAERRQLHAQAAAAIEAAYPGDAGLALTMYEHWRRAGEPLRALPYAASAAEQSLYNTPAERVRALVEAALAGAGAAPDDTSAARLLRVLGEAQQSLGEPEAARAAFEQSMRAAERMGDLRRQAEALIDLAWVGHRTSQYAASAEQAEAAIALAEAAGGQATLARALNMRAMLHERQGQRERARELLLRALDAAQAAGASEEIAEVMSNLGLLTTVQTGDTELAQSYYNRSLAICRATGNHRKAFVNLIRLGMICDDTCDDADARRYYDQALALARELSAQPQLALVLNNYSSLLVRLLEVGQAQAYLEEGIAITRRLGNVHLEAYLLQNLGASLIEQGDYSQAEQQLALARAIAEQHDPQMLPILLRTLGDTARARGDLELGELRYDEGIAIALQRGTTGMISALELERALNRWLRGDLAGAAADAESVLLRAPTTRSYIPEQIAALTTLALARASQGDLAAAEEQLGRAIKLAELARSGTLEIQIAIAEAQLAACAGDAQRSAELCAAIARSPHCRPLQRERVLPLIAAAGAGGQAAPAP